MKMNRTSAWIRSNWERYLFAFILLFLLSLVPPPENLQGAESSRDTVAQGENVPTNQIVITYFHTNVRCHTCKLLEKYSREIVEKDFAKEIEDKRIVFKTINVDVPENKHFSKDYGLYTKSLIVSARKDGKEIRWKNLPGIWKHVRNRERFEQYVRSEIEAYLKGL